MKQEAKKHRLTKRVILLCALLIVIAFSWYFIDKQYENESSQNNKEVSGVLNSYKESKKDTALAKPEIVKVDTSKPVQKTTEADSNSNAIAKIKSVRIKPRKIGLSDTQARMQNANISQPAPAKTNDVVVEKTGKWKIVIKDDILCVYPLRRWKDIIVLYPVVSGGKDKKWLFRPDFPGVVYRSDTSADMYVSDTKYKVVVEKFTAAEANNKMPFFISLKRHPEFVIFGENEDLQNWYIYTKNQLSEYTPAMNTGNKFTFNVQ